MMRGIAAGTTLALMIFALEPAYLLIALPSSTSFWYHANEFEPFLGGSDGAGCVGTASPAWSLLESVHGEPSPHDLDLARF